VDPRVLKLINDVMHDVVVSSIEFGFDDCVLLFHSAGHVHVDGQDYATYWMDHDRELHRDNHLPAVVYADGSGEWWVHGEPD
jgi:hypothetical protein